MAYRASVQCTRLSDATLPMRTVGSLQHGSLRRCAAVPHVHALTSPLTTSHPPRRAVHIEHSTDIHKWRNAEKEEVRRQFRGGVKLGSEFVKFREQEAMEKQLIEEDKFTNWRVVYAYSLGVVVLLFALNMMMVFVKPNPSPEYVPYENTSAATTTPSTTPTAKN